MSFVGPALFVKSTRGHKKDKNWYFQRKTRADKLAQINHIDMSNQKKLSLTDKKC